MARVDLVYPKIPDSGHAPDGQCIAFEKYDGSNMHWVWDPELGWHAFGTRRNRYDLDSTGVTEFNAFHGGMEQAPLIFMRDLAEPLAEIIRRSPEYGRGEVIAFTEFLGPNSFAGMHAAGGRKQLVLFDVLTDRGFVPPEQFVRDFSGVNTARVVYRGRLTGAFVHDVRAGKYDVQEGVVCKGVEKTGGVWMIKIKTNAYMQQLKQAFADDWEKYWE